MEKFDIRYSIEALGEELKSVVKEQSIDFIRNIDFFKEIDRIYVRSIIRGVSERIEENSKNDKFLEQVNWDNILNYCIWASSPLDDSQEGIDDKNDGRDSSLSWTRKEIASFLQSGLQSGLQSDAIPISKKDLVWRALEPCFEDKDPTPEKEEKYLKDNNYYQEAINCVRGIALETLVMYGLWIIRARSLKPEDCRFDHYPEIKGVLERHLDVDYEPSLAVRSIYGRYLPWLFYLDNSWTIQNLQNIFSEEPGLEKYYDAAWSTYITFCDSFDSVFKKIRKYYEKMLDKAKNSSKESYGDDSPEARYICRLMVFYYRGTISLDDPLITRLFEELDLSLRKTAISYIGRALREQNKKSEDLPEVKERLLSLMDYRFKELKEKDSQEDRLELAAFGGWFASNQFEIKWSLEKLKETLELCRFIEPDYFVMDFLKDQGHSYPDLVMDCLDLIIKYATDHSEFGLWVLQTERILDQVLCSESQQAKNKAEDLIHWLVAKGYRNFGNLLT